MNNGVDMLLHKKITALCCIVFLLAGVGGYTADAAINTEVGSLSGMPLPAPKKSETGKKITLNLASRLLTLYEGTFVFILWLSGRLKRLLRLVSFPFQKKK